MKKVKIINNRNAREKLKQDEYTNENQQIKVMQFYINSYNNTLLQNYYKIITKI